MEEGLILGTSAELIATVRLAYSYYVLGAKADTSHSRITLCRKRRELKPKLLKVQRERVAGKVVLFTDCDLSCIRVLDR